MECHQLSEISFTLDSKLVRIEKRAFFNCTSLQSIVLPASVEYVGEECFVQCSSLSTLIFALPSHVRELLDLPPGLPGFTDIPDCVEILSFCGVSGEICQHTLVFSRESNLKAIAGGLGETQVHRRSFLQVSSNILKRFRLMQEFDGDSRS
jgi:hypothetical protein